MKLVTLKAKDKESAKSAIDFLFSINAYFDFEPLDDGEGYEIRTSQAFALLLEKEVLRKSREKKVVKPFLHLEWA